MFSARYLIILILVFLFACRHKIDKEQVSYAAFLSDNDYVVGQTRLELYDESRDRPIKTEIWYPSFDTSGVNLSKEYPFLLPPTSFDSQIEEGEFPLVIMSHGTGGNRISLMWLACELVGNGFIVAAMDHYGNTYDNKIPENFVKVWDRPRDVSFVLDHLLGFSKMQGSIDTARIAMLGYSLGGYTAIALAGGQIKYRKLVEYSKTKAGKSEFETPEMGDLSTLLTEDIINKGIAQNEYLKDERFDSFVALAPVLGQGFPDSASLSSINKPILIMGAKDDNRAVLDMNAKYYHRLISKSKYKEIEGGHYIFLNEAKSDLIRNVPLLYKDEKKIDRGEVHDKVDKIVLSFLQKSLK